MYFKHKTIIIMFVFLHMMFFMMHVECDKITHIIYNKIKYHNGFVMINCYDKHVNSNHNKNLLRYGEMYKFKCDDDQCRCEVEWRDRFVTFNAFVSTEDQWACRIGSKKMCKWFLTDEGPWLIKKKVIYREINTAQNYKWGEI